MLESFNAMILKARAKPIISMFETVRVALMKRIHIRSNKLRAYHGEFCPIVEDMLEELKKKAMDYTAHWNGENQFEIETTYSTRFRVYLGEGTCSCRRWELTGLPCAHAISAIYYLDLKPESYVDKFYRKETFLKAYNNFLGAMDSSEMWPKTKWPPLMPPTAEKMLGRPKVYKRKPRAGETSQAATQGSSRRRGRAADKPVKITRKGTIMNCSLCHQPNHNARSCPKKPTPPTESVQRQGGLDIPTANDPSTSRQNKKVKRGKSSKTDQESALSKEKPSKAGKNGAQAGVKKPSKKTSKANLPPSTPDDANDPLASVPDEWWNVTSLEQASQLTKDSSKPQVTPSRVTRSRAAAIVDEAIKQSQEKQSFSPVRVPSSRSTKKRTTETNQKCTQESSCVSQMVAPVRVTPSRSAKKRITTETTQKCTQETSCVAPEKPPPVRRKLQVRKSRVLRDPLDGPAIMIDKPNPRHFIKPQMPAGASTLTSDVRFSRSSRENLSQETYIAPDAPSSCRQM